MEDRTHTDKSARVRAIVDDAIAELLLLGMESRSAAALLMAIQATIRIDDEAEADTFVHFVGNHFGLGDD